MSQRSATDIVPLSPGWESVKIYLLSLEGFCHILKELTKTWLVILPKVMLEFHVQLTVRVIGRRKYHPKTVGHSELVNDLKKNVSLKQ